MPLKPRLKWCPRVGRPRLMSQSTYGSFEPSVVHSDGLSSNSLDDCTIHFYVNYKRKVSSSIFRACFSRIQNHIEHLRCVQWQSRALLTNTCTETIRKAFFTRQLKKQSYSVWHYLYVCSPVYGIRQCNIVYKEPVKQDPVQYQNNQ